MGILRLTERVAQVLLKAIAIILGVAKIIELIVKGVMALSSVSIPAIIPEGFIQNNKEVFGLLIFIGLILLVALVVRISYACKYSRDTGADFESAWEYTGKDTCSDLW